MSEQDTENVTAQDGTELGNTDDPRDVQIADLTQRLKAVSRKYQEQLDEMAAFRSRMEARARADQARRSAEVVRIFFEPVQNLQRTLESSGDLEDLHKGVAMVHKQCIEALERLGLVSIPGLGTRFNPELHEAIHMEQVQTPELDDTITAVHTEGWMVDGRAIQVARVTVGRYVAPVADA